MAFSLGFLTRLILPALLKQSLLVGLVGSIISGFLGPGEPALRGNFIPLFTRLASVSAISDSLASVITFRYVFSFVKIDLLLRVRWCY
jgi:hypothetical protein